MRLIEDMKTKVEMMTKWMEDSGLTVNEDKTEICLFYKNDHPLVNLTINDVIIRRKHQMNVLWVMFDSFNEKSQKLMVVYTFSSNLPFFS